jgi:hypothetical protein
MHRFYLSEHNPFSREEDMVAFLSRTSLEEQDGADSRFSSMNLTASPADDRSSDHGNNSRLPSLTRGSSVGSTTTVCRSSAGDQMQTDEINPADAQLSQHHELMKPLPWALRHTFNTWMKQAHPSLSVKSLRHHRRQLSYLARRSL